MQYQHTVPSAGPTEFFTPFAAALLYTILQSQYGSAVKQASASLKDFTQERRCTVE